MKAVIQRVTGAEVKINGSEVRKTGPGLMVLVGFCEGDQEHTVQYMIDKIVNLRIFDDDNGAMNRSLLDCGGELMVVSNFTLYANCRKGRRPSFVDALKPEFSVPLYNKMLALLRQGGYPFQSGEFGADMEITLTNDGPVTILLDSEEIMPAGKGGGKS